MKINNNYYNFEIYNRQNYRTNISFRGMKRINIPIEELSDFIAKNPQAELYTIAKHYKVSEPTIAKLIRQYQINYVSKALKKDIKIEKVIVRK